MEAVLRVRRPTICAVVATEYCMVASARVEAVDYENYAGKASALMLTEVGWPRMSSVMTFPVPRDWEIPGV